MRRAHRHDDIELNLAPAGPLTYLFGGDRVEIPAGHIAVFWGSRPHQLVGLPTGLLYGVTVPVPVFLRRGAPHALVARLLQGPPLVAMAPACHCDLHHLSQWARDLHGASDEQREVALLEIEARVRRIFAEARAAVVEIDPSSQPLPSVDGSFSRVSTMAGFIATHCQEPIDVSDIARAANVSPTYGMRIFRRIVGTTVLAYLTQCRVAEAQRMLITTDASVAEIAATSGFGSLSQFYASFSAACGQAPGAYRRACRTGNATDVDDGQV